MKKVNFSVQDNESGIRKITLTSIKYLEQSSNDSSDNGLDLDN